MRAATRGSVVGLTCLAILAGASVAWAAPGWRLQTSPNPGSFQNELLGVGTLSPTDAWAAGVSQKEGDYCGPLIEHYDGTSWKGGGAVFRLGSYDTMLLGLRMTSSTNGWAVGTDDQGYQQHYVTLIERYDGTKWTVQRSPNPAANDALFAVAARSATAAWAVGNQWPPPNGMLGCPPDQGDGLFGGWLFGSPLIEHFDGSTWRTESAPSPGLCASNLYGVSASSTTDVWAVGTMSNLCNDSEYYSLVEHFDGSTWTVVPSPDYKKKGTILNAVSAYSPTDVWAVGSVVSDHVSQGIIFHYDGSGWTTLRVKHGAINWLTGVKATSPTNVWAVGGWAPVSGSTQPQILHFDGTNWSSQAVPKFSDSAELNAVAATGTGNAFAVGSVDRETGPDTLVLHHR